MLRTQLKVLFTLAFLSLLGLMMSKNYSYSVGAAESEKLLRHVVMFKFQDNSTPEQIANIVDEFRKLPAKIPQIHEFEFGTDNSPEGLADGFTHCFLVTFKSEKDRDAYLPHKEHLAFVEILKPHLDRVLVVDYWAGK